MRRRYTAGGIVIGIIGLLWFLFFAGTGTFCLVRPDELRNYSSSKYTWTDREIRIGAACNVVVGSAGLQLVFSRLLLPLFNQSAMPEMLFIYGSLLPGCAPPAMADLCKRLKRIGPARVRGRLYDLGDYPAMVFIKEFGGVRGEVVEVDSDETWQALDEYEGCPHPAAGDGLFRRVWTIAMFDNGEKVNCWVYVYMRELGNAKPIESGCWRTHRGLL